MKTPNLRTMKITTASGKDVKSTSMLKGESHTTSSQKGTNETVQYTTSGGPSKDNLGGENTNS